jgi:hypothetical protein
MNHDNAGGILNYIPFVLPPVLSTTRPNRCGRGVLVYVSAAANTPVAVTHNIGREVQGAIVVMHNLSAGASSFPPRIALTSGTRTTQVQTVQFDATATNALVFLF